MLCATRKPSSVKKEQLQLLQGYHHYVQYSFKRLSCDINVQQELPRHLYFNIAPPEVCQCIYIIHRDSKLLDISIWENKQHSPCSLHASHFLFLQGNKNTCKSFWTLSYLFSCLKRKINVPQIPHKRERFKIVSKRFYSILKYSLLSFIFFLQCL